jgi:hypothetical protein
MADKCPFSMQDFVSKVHIYKDNHRIALEDIEDNLRISDKIMMKMMLEDEEED